LLSALKLYRLASPAEAKLVLSEFGVA
jgi:hypothetical protein